MPMFWRKPTTIDAEQFTSKDDPPRGVMEPDYVLFDWHVVTTQGRRVPVSIGEWIVAEDDGVHFYPIADEQFRKLYEPVQ